MASAMVIGNSKKKCLQIIYQEVATMAIYHLDHKVTGNFLQTHKPIVLDDTLPGVPKTILQIALCHKPNVNVTPAMIKEHMAEGMYAIRSGLRILQDRGYLHIEQSHYNGRFTTATYDYYESPSLNPHYNPAAPESAGRKCGCSGYGLSVCRLPACGRSAR